MMPVDAISVLEEKAARYPELRAVRGTTGNCRWIEVQPETPNGFSVTLEEAVDEWRVHYGNTGAHDHFLEPDEALERVAFALSDQCRLRETWRGRFPQKAVLEQRNGDKWRPMSTIGVLFWPFWRRKTYIVLQNNIIRGNAEA